MSDLRYSFKREYVFIGTTADNLRVLVSGKLDRQPKANDWQTIEHGTVHDPECLSLTSAVFKGKKNIGRNYVTGGATLTDAARIVKAAPGFTVAEARELAAIGERWHLNTMRSGCTHMELPEDTSYDARRHITCPETDYKYGSAWLTEPLPADVRARFIELMSKGNTEPTDY